ncbi:MAG: DUF1801 domain-containing protein [Flavobacteriales bacterium]|jgi:uncharacterized protein YdhG (YjbR/CyaY superfamily)|nr:DUF1801 domain-containing protein [Flavobacteriales bacterium]
MRSLLRTADEYFDQLDADRKEPLLRLRRMILGIWPGIVEDMDREMPTYHLNGRTLCALANQKNFMALYILPHDLLHAFKKDLLVYDRGRSCIRFKRLEADTLDLFDRIIKYTGSQMHESQLTEVRSRRRPSRVLG